VSDRIANPKLAIALHVLLLNWNVVYVPLSVSEVGLEAKMEPSVQFKDVHRTSTILRNVRWVTAKAMFCDSSKARFRSLFNSVS
jgi:hypothetical protein